MVASRFAFAGLGFQIVWTRMGQKQHPTARRQQDKRKNPRRRNFNAVSGLLSRYNSSCADLFAKGFACNKTSEKKLV